MTKYIGNEYCVSHIITCYDTELIFCSSSQRDNKLSTPSRSSWRTFDLYLMIFSHRPLPKSVFLTVLGNEGLSIICMSSKLPGHTWTYTTTGVSGEPFAVYSQIERLFTYDLSSRVSRWAFRMKGADFWNLETSWWTPTMDGCIAA